MRLAIVGLLLVALSAHAAGCSDGSPRATTSGGSWSPPRSTSGGPSSSSGGVPDAGDLADASVGHPDPGRLCDPLEQRGEDIEATVYAGEPPPAIGGTMTPGTYKLTLIERYTGAPGGPLPEEEDAGGPPPPTSGQGGRATMYILGDAIRFVESWGAYDSLPPDSSRGVSYVAQGTALEMTELCPSAGEAQSLPYTVQGNSIALYTTIGRLSYQRSFD